MDEARSEIAGEAQLSLEPMADLLVVDRQTWVAGNIRTLQSVFGELDLPGAQSRLVAWEGGMFLGLVARAVLAQYDPFRDVLIIVYPNLGELAAGDGLRWLVFHELTHLAQFRQAPWIRDYIVERGRQVLAMDDAGWVREAGQRLRAQLPDIVRRIRRADDDGDDGIAPLIQILPDRERQIVLDLQALLTLLEGHATHVTDLVSQRVIPSYDQLQRRIDERRRRRPAAVKVLESIAGLEMKRQQYVVGRRFCEAVWNEGGAEALAPAWVSPDGVPTNDELRDHRRWLERVGTAQS